MPIDLAGCLIDSDGVLRHFGQDAFTDLAQDQSRCFLCGISREQAAFNDEHVVPDWILRRCQLHAKRVTLPNGTGVSYGQYKLRCCVSCNSQLGEEVEQPISRLLDNDFSAAVDALRQPNNYLLYQWLCLLFIKTHLRDREFRIHRDRRAPDARLSELYEWRALHHVHSVARTASSGAIIGPRVQGSILLFEMAETSEPFDYGDLYAYSTMLLRIGSVGLVAVLNDSCAVSDMLRSFLSGIAGPLSPIQLREIAARAAYGNLLLSTRPTFRSELHDGRDLFMVGDHPDTFQIGVFDSAALGAMIQRFCAQMVDSSSTPNKQALIERLGSGNATLLYNDDGSFIRWEESADDTPAPLSASNPP